MRSFVHFIVDLRINGTLQTGAVKNRTYRGRRFFVHSVRGCDLQTGAIKNRTYRGAKVSIYF